MNTFNNYIEYMNSIYSSSSFENTINSFVHDFKYNAIDRIFFIGNGGSAALASHFAQDINKAAQTSLNENSLNRCTAISLCDNNAFITALANDEGYENIFTQQLEAHKFNPIKDRLFAISCSGNSKNIINAINYVNGQVKHTVYAMTAFDGGKIHSMLPMENIMHINTNDIYTAESLHSVLHHYIILKIKE